jgi:hypothetical protein
MPGGNALQGRFEKRVRLRPISYAAEISDDGLALGAGTILARMTRDSAAAPVLALEADGTMIEAKGIGYAEMLQDPYLGGDVIPGRWLKQARSQVDAAGSRDVEWFFAEPEAARKAKELFGAREKLQTIKIFVIPAEAP